MHPEITQSPIICETSRLILRKFDARDTESLLGLRGDPAVMQFSVAGPESREDIRDKYLPNCLLRYSRDGFGQWAVVQKSDHALVGECGICVQKIDGKREFEVSYRLRRDCWGQGLATEAARACRDYGFQKGGIGRLVSIIEAANVASVRVAQKMGMTLEKRARFHGIDCVVYCIANPAQAT